MEVVAQKFVTAQKHEFLPALQASLDSTPTGSQHWNAISTFRHLALYSRRFPTFNFAPKLLALCVTASV